MEYVKDIGQEGIMIFRLDTEKGKKDIVYVRFLSNGTKITALVVNIN